MQKEIDYNKKASKRFWWDPSWFGASDFDNDLVINIKTFQKSLGLLADGLCGPITHRRIWTDRESKNKDLEPPPTKFQKSIIHNGKLHNIKWDKVVHWSDEAGLTTADGAYKSQDGLDERKPTMFVNHWDVCLNSKSCAQVLQQRGISVHFAIDNDGTIYQLLDTQHIAWHAGSRLINDLSIGVEISNAYYTKYQDTYVERGFGERPIIDNVEVHGDKLEPFLGFYPIQLEALTALWEAISRIHDIPLKVPEDSGNEIMKKHPESATGKFHGFVSHYHLTNKKIDCAGLQHIEIVNKAKEL